MDMDPMDMDGPWPWCNLLADQNTPTTGEYSMYVFTRIDYGRLYVATSQM